MARKPKKLSWTAEQVAHLQKFVSDHLPTRTIGEALASLGIGGKTAPRAKAKASAKRRSVKKSAVKRTGKRTGTRGKTTKTAKRA